MNTNVGTVAPWVLLSPSPDVGAVEHALGVFTGNDLIMLCGDAPENTVDSIGVWLAAPIYRFIEVVGKICVDCDLICVVAELFCLSTKFVEETFGIWDDGAPVFQGLDVSESCK